MARKSLPNYIKHGTTLSQIYRPTAHYVRLIGKALCCVLFLCLTSTSIATSPRIALVIPHTTSKAQIIYDEILAGVQLEATTELVQFNLTSTSTEEELSNWLAEQDPSAVITVGKSAHAKVIATNIDVPLIAGGMGSLPPGVSGVALAGDPDEFFSNARLIAPQVKRIYIVYNEELNGWWIEQAELAAIRHGYELISLQASSLKSGAKMYKKLLKESKPDTDAIWIPLVSIVPSKTVLPLVLRKAWDKHLVVFTNSPSHAKQGALFSLYPNNTSMGKQLMQLALQQREATDSAPEVVLAKEMKRAFNWRTASHLGLEYTLEEGAGFDRIYPVQ